MKLTAILVLAWSLQAAAGGYAQSITFSGKNVPLIQVFADIKKQTDYVFIYRPEALKNAKKVTIDASAMLLTQFLDKILADTDLAYSIKGTTVFIRQILPSVSGFSQNEDPPVVISGKIISESGTAIAGVSVQIKGTGTGVATDSEGKYSISIPSQNRSAVLVISFVGYETQEIILKSNSSIVNVRLKLSAARMDEIIVVGYGTVSKAEVTGSVSKVKMDELKKAPVLSFDQALAGRIAGVQVSATDGQPGTEMNITIRGANSITQSNAPLYVIDGFPVEDPQLSSINMDDIASMTILKDASATAIYGARGSNGVIVIETNKGKPGKTIVSLNNSFGFQQVPHFTEVMDPYEFVKYQLEYDPVRATQTYLSNSKTLESYRGAEKVDWLSEIFRNSFSQISNLSVRGGNKDTRFSISGSYYNQQGAIINTGYKRYQGNFTVDHNISGKLKVGLVTNYSNLITNGQRVIDGVEESNKNPVNFLMIRGWGYRPISGNGEDLLDEDIDYELDDGTAGNLRFSPLAGVNNDYSRAVNRNLLANAFAEYKITDGLTFKSTFSYNDRDTDRDQFFNSKTPQGSSHNPSNFRGVNARVNTGYVTLLSNENILTYDKRFFNKHRITVISGFSHQAVKNGIKNFAVQNIPNETLGMDGVDAGVPYETKTSSSRNTLASFFGRAKYAFSSKYIVELNYRLDGSSKFAPGNRWGYFPSTSVAWNMHQEGFMKNINFLDESKIRVSYGRTGNNRVGDFDYLPRYQISSNYSYPFNDHSPTTGTAQESIGYKNLKWETSTQFDIGYDVALFNNRVMFTVDHYYKRTNDLLLNADQPTTTGVSRAVINVGSIRNRGWELTMNTVNVAKRNFRWESNINISFNKNKVLALARGQESFFSIVNLQTSWNNTPLYISTVGQPVGLFYGLIFDGIYQLEDFDSPSAGTYVLKAGLPKYASAGAQPGTIRYKDITGDGITDLNDAVVIGSGLPKHTGGMMNTFTYKGLSLNVFFQWSYGNDVYNANRIVLEGNEVARLNVNQYRSYESRWTPENKSNTLFKAGGEGPHGLHSSRVLEDGSYLRLKTLSAGYSFPDKMIRKLGLSALSVNIAAQNLFTWTNYSGVDPDVSTQHSALTPGYDFSAYPGVRTLVCGLSVKF